MNKRPVKICTHCHRPRLLCSFYPRKRGGSKLRAVCKFCLKDDQVKENQAKARQQRDRLEALVQSQVAHLRDWRKPMARRDVHQRFVDNAGVAYYVGIVRHKERFRFQTVANDNGVLVTLQSRFLPGRSTPEEAWADLHAYAVRKGWQKEGVVNDVK